MSTCGKINIPEFKCEEFIMNPTGPDSLDQYLQMAITYNEDNCKITKLCYHLPNHMQLKSVNTNIEFHREGILKDKPGYYQLTAYIKKRRW